MIMALSNVLLTYTIWNVPIASTQDNQL